jgi:hypothetical protein
VLEEQVAQCDVLLAVIGKGWIDARDATGARHIDIPQDFVRIELESALKQGKRVIPVLMHEARLPRSDELPEAVRPLARRNAVRLTHERFRADAQALIKALQQILKEAENVRAAEMEVARQAQADAERKREEEAARERARSQREAEEQARLEPERVRLAAIAALSPEQIAKAEELANWDSIKESSRGGGLSRAFGALSRRSVLAHCAAQARSPGRVRAIVGEGGARIPSRGRSCRCAADAACSLRAACDGPAFGRAVIGCRRAP